MWSGRESGSFPIRTTGPGPPEGHAIRGGLSGKERIVLKRQTSRANGTKFGRPRKVDDAEHIATAKRMKVDGHTGRYIATYLGRDSSKWRWRRDLNPRTV